MNFPSLRRLAGLALGAALLAACSTRPAAGEPTAALAATLPAAGVTLNAPGPTSNPPPTALPATATAEPPAPTLPPSPTPTGLIGPANFPPNVDPLTGETVADPAALDRIPVAIKVANTAEVRPQWGLSAADLVFEHFTEGGITRFTAVFLGYDAPQVGSVRSARLIDQEILNMYHALIGYSGASPGVNQRMREVSFFERILTPDFGIAEPFWRDANIPVPHNLFTSTKNLRATGQQRGVNVGRQDLHGMAFSETPPPGGEPAKQVTLSYNVSYVLWFYQEGLGKQYFRWNDGVEHTDRGNSKQLAASNVVVLYANHVCDWTIVEDNHNPDAYWYSIQIQIWGAGPAKIFRDGQAYDVTWVRNAPADMLGFVDASNNPFPLKPGKTWFQIVQLDSPTKVEKGAEWDVDPKEPGCVKKP